MPQTSLFLLPFTLMEKNSYIGQTCRYVLTRM